jgi:hypothetical protein
LKDIPSNPVKDSREKPGSLIRAPCVPASRNNHLDLSATVPTLMLRVQSASFDQRRRPETLRTAIATAFF